MTLVTIFTTVLAETALDCFLVGKVYYGNPDSGSTTSDFDKIQSLSKDHVITSIKGCESISGKVKAIQIIYGVWIGGEVQDEVKLNAFGDLSGDCDTFSI